MCRQALPVVRCALAYSHQAATVPPLDMISECRYDCRHPLWGGEGFCTEDHDDSTVADESCMCSAGFVSRNAIGNPSCVPKRVLVGAYIVLATMTGTVTVLLVWNALQFYHLSVRARSRRAVLRLRVLLSGRCGQSLVRSAADWHLFGGAFDC